MTQRLYRPARSARSATSPKRSPRLTSSSLQVKLGTCSPIRTCVLLHKSVCNVKWLAKHGEKPYAACSRGGRGQRGTLILHRKTRYADQAPFLAHPTCSSTRPPAAARRMHLLVIRLDLPGLIRPFEDPHQDQPAHEAADMSKEGHASLLGCRAERSDTIEQLLDKPEPDQQPRPDPDRERDDEHEQQRAD